MILSVPPSEKGFTLIETIMAVVILSIAVAGIMQVFYTGLAPKTSPLPIEMTTGTHLAQEGLERRMAQKAIGGFSQIPLGTTTETLSGQFSSYTRQITVTTWGGSTDVKQVTVTVTHSGRTVASATTLLANY